MFVMLEEIELERDTDFLSFEKMYQISLTVSVRKWVADRCEIANKQTSFMPTQQKTTFPVLAAPS